MTEDQLEQEALGWLADVGYTVVYGPDIAPDGPTPERDNYRKVILIGRLRAAIDRLNPGVPAAARDDALKQVVDLGSPALLAANRRFHQLLVTGVPVLYQKDGETRGDFVRLVEPAFITFVVSDSYIGAHPATAAGLDAHLMFLPKNRRVHWSVIAKGTSILPFAETAIGRGGHVSLGLGDYGYPELGAPRNADLVRRVVALAKAAGREIATPQEARQMLMHVEHPATGDLGRWQAQSGNRAKEC